MQRNPDLFEAHYFYARLCFSEGKLEEAARHFERAAELNAGDCQSPALVQQVYASLGMPEKALAASRRVVERAARDIERNPGNPRPLYLGANALAMLGRIEEPDAWAERALALDPDDILTKYNIACHRCLAGDIDAAFELPIGLLP